MPSSVSQASKADTPSASTTPDSAPRTRRNPSPRQAVGGSQAQASVFSEATSLQSTIPSTRIIATELSSMEKSREISDAIAQRASKIVPTKYVIDHDSGGERGGPEIGPLTKAFVMEKYNLKYDLAIFHADLDFNETFTDKVMEIGHSQMERIEQALMNNRPTGLVMLTDGTHSVPVVMGMDSEAIYAVSLDAAGDAPTLYQTELLAAFAP